MGQQALGGGNYGTNTNWDRVCSDKNNWETGVWYRVAGTWDGTTDAASLKIYIDGVQNASRQATQATIKTNDNPVHIGNLLGGYSHWDGLLDEIRISNTGRSAAWNKGEYNTLNDSLLSYGTKQIQKIGASYQLLGWGIKTYGG